MFESLADCLPSSLWALYSLPYLREIATRVKQKLGDDAVPMVGQILLWNYKITLPCIRLDLKVVISTLEI